LGICVTASEENGQPRGVFGAAPFVEGEYLRQKLSLALLALPNNRIANRLHSFIQALLQARADFTMLGTLQRLVSSPGFIKGTERRVFLGREPSRPPWREGSEKA
jgi:hypothetical protein